MILSRKWLNEFVIVVYKALSCCEGDFHNKKGSTYKGISSSKNCIAKSKSAWFL
jgi:hypothetical protein